MFVTALAVEKRYWSILDYLELPKMLCPLIWSHNTLDEKWHMRITKIGLLSYKIDCNNQAKAVLYQRNNITQACAVLTLPQQQKANCITDSLKVVLGYLI